MDGDTPTSQIQQLVADCLRFVEMYKWIHDFQVTHIFEGTVFTTQPQWFEVLKLLNTDELNILPFLGKESLHKFPAWPASLHKFLSESARLSIDRNPVGTPPTGTQSFTKSAMLPDNTTKLSLQNSSTNTTQEQLLWASNTATASTITQHHEHQSSSSGRIPHCPSKPVTLASPTLLQSPSLSHPLTFTHSQPTLQADGISMSSPLERPSQLPLRYPTHPSPLTTPEQPQLLLTLQSSSHSFYQSPPSQSPQLPSPSQSSSHSSHQPPLPSPTTLQSSELSTSLHQKPPPLQLIPHQQKLTPSKQVQATPHQQPPSSTPQHPPTIDQSMARGMNPKKLHEVSRLSCLVNSIVRDAACDLVVDVGSGLGYLDHVLHQIYSIPVLGLETSDSHVSSAEMRAAQQGLKCGGVKSVKFDLTNDVACFERFKQLLSSTGASGLACTCCSSQKEPSHTQPRVCLIGLHCCGDLTPTMLHLYHNVDNIKAICLVSCCYHKMTSQDDGVYPNFPLSSGCKNLWSSFNPPWLISPATLRLGAQETRSRWRTQTKEDHDKHTRHVAYRGLLELADCGDPLLKRKLVRKCDFSSYDAFLHSYFQSEYFSENEIKYAKSELHNLYDRHKDNIDCVEIITALQVIFQPVIETLIYTDRLLYLREQGHTNSKVYPVFDESISPRNLAIVAIK